MGLADRDYMKAESWQREQRKRLADWQWRSMPDGQAARRSPLPAVLAVAAAVLIAGGLGYMFAGGFERDPEPTPAVMVWGGKTFTSKAQFKQWLAQRGKSYPDWAQNHPAAAARVDRLPLTATETPS